MAATVLNSGQSTGVSSSSFGFSYGFSPTEGNLLIAVVTRNNTPADISDDSSTWTQLISDVHGSATTAVFWKVAASSEPTSETFSGSSAGKWAGGVLEISGQHSTPIDISATGTGTTASPISPDILTTVQDTIIVAGFGQNNYTSSITLDTGLASRWDARTTASSAVATGGGSVDQAAIDQTGTFTHTISSSAEWLGFTIAVAPSSGNVTLNADAASFLITTTDAVIGSPKDSEGATLWFNNEWWKNPFWGTTWWTATSAFSINAEAATFLITGTDADLIPQGADISLTADAGSFLITGTDAAIGIPFIAAAGSFLITGTDAFFQIEFTSEEFIISNSTTFDNKGIIYGSDICYNSSTDLGYTVVARIDIDSIFLSGIYGTAPQPYQIHKLVGEVTVSSKTVVEFNNGEWTIISTTPIGL